ncbi:glycine zipper 2TM domain-containing protein [Caldimonas sp. KR1-144]|uniref:glycine zipper 2TM domain-containing protein n=1 Tax=Caldimonas sp. KR1-144 TaxID=3400911 RepID=UPI003C102EB1
MNTLPNPSSAPGAVVPTRGTSMLAWIAGAAVLAIAGVAGAVALQRANAPQGEPVEAKASLASNEKLIQGQDEKPRSSNASPRPAPAAKSVAQAPVCAVCGTVESVQAVKQKGEGTGVGAVGGAVVGGVVGHQMGGGRGKDALTVLGAVGGAVAGHEIEKNVRAETVYTVKVRMDDGTLRTLTRKEPVSVGSRVRVEGNSLSAV